MADAAVAGATRWDAGVLALDAEAVAEVPGAESTCPALHPRFRMDLSGAALRVGVACGRTKGVTCGRSEP